MYGFCLSCGNILKKTKKCVYWRSFNWRFYLIKIPVVIWWPVTPFWVTILLHKCQLLLPLTCNQAQLYHPSYVFLCWRSLQFVSSFQRERCTNETKKRAWLQVMFPLSSKHALWISVLPFAGTKILTNSCFSALCGALMLHNLTYFTPQITCILHQVTKMPLLLVNCTTTLLVIEHIKFQILLNRILLILLNRSHTKIIYYKTV